MFNIPRNWIIFALLVHMLAAWYSVGHYHNDEYHQILAFTASKIGLADNSELMWEYQHQMRSGFQPFLAYSLTKPLILAGVNSPYIHAYLLRLLSGFLSIVALVLLVQAITPEFQNNQIRQRGIYYLLFLWLQVFVNVRFSSEGWAASLFILGFSLYFLKTSRNTSMNLFIGFVLGLAFLCRYQTGLMLAGLGLWMIFIQRENMPRITTIIFGGIIAIVTGIGCDWWLYNEFVFTAWNYLNVNLIQGHIEAFTNEPWWYYIYYSAVQILPPITLVLPAFIIAFWVLFRKHPITWITIPFVLFHQYVGHKEMRFLFPVLPFAPLMYALVIDKIVTNNVINWPHCISKILRFIFFISLIINSILLMLVIFLPASKEVVMWDKCLSNIKPSESANILTYDIGELNMHFYNTQKLNLVSIDQNSSINEIVDKYNYEPVYFASRKSNHLKILEDSGLQFNMVCQTVPDWLMYFNINNWTSRASLWRLWEIQSNKPEFEY